MLDLLGDIPARKQYALDFRMIEEIVGDRLQHVPFVCEFIAYPASRECSGRPSGAYAQQLILDSYLVFGMDKLEYAPPSEPVWFLSDGMRRRRIRIQDSSIGRQHHDRIQEAIDYLCEPRLVP